MADFISKEQWLKSGFRIGGEAGLAQLKIGDDFATHDLEIVSHIANPMAEKKNCQRVERTVRENFQEWIIEEDTMPRETTSYNDVIAGCDLIEQLPQFGKQMLKVTVQHKHKPAADCTKSVNQRSAYAMRRAAMNRL